MQIGQSVYAGWEDYGGYGSGAMGGRQLTNRIHKINDNRWNSAQESAARNRAYKGKVELERLKKIYSNINKNNPYQNMDLSFQNLEVSKKEAENQRDIVQQQQSNLLQSLRAGGGGSWMAAAIDRQGQIAAQKVSASIGEQESRNRMLLAQQSERVQELERKGRLIPQQFEAKKLSLLMGMTQEEYNMNRQLELGYFNIKQKVKAQAKAAQQAANASLMSTFMSAAGAAGGGGGAATGAVDGL